ALDPPPGPCFREAFAAVAARQAPGDTIWATHAEVYTLYYGPGAPVLSCADLAGLERAARAGRVWQADSRPHAGGPLVPAAADRLRAAGAIPVAVEHWPGVQVTLWRPATRPGAASP